MVTVLRESSNGRTTGSDPVNWGSNPYSRTNQARKGFLISQNKNRPQNFL